MRWSLLSRQREPIAVLLEPLLDESELDGSELDGSELVGSLDVSKLEGSLELSGPSGPSIPGSSWLMVGSDWSQLVVDLSPL